MSASMPGEGRPAIRGRGRVVAPANLVDRRWRRRPPSLRPSSAAALRGVLERAGTKCIAMLYDPAYPPPSSSPAAAVFRCYLPFTLPTSSRMQHCRDSIAKLVYRLHLHAE